MSVQHAEAIFIKLVCFFAWLAVRFHNFELKQCLFVCLESHEQFCSYLATVTITGDRAVNLDLCLTLTVQLLTVRVLLRVTHTSTRDPFLRPYRKDPWFSITSECHALGKVAITTYFKRLRFDAVARVGFELTTYRMLSESTTARLPQPRKQEMA
jgi:hypothetical protein